MKLGEKENYILDGFFWYYTNFPEFSLYDLEKLIGIDRTTIGKYYSKRFNNNYKTLSKSKGKFKKILSDETKKRISIQLKGKPKPLRSQSHRNNLSLALKGKNYNQRFGIILASYIKDRIAKSNTGKKRDPRSKEWKSNLSKSLKGRKVWNKGLKGVQSAWNKITFPEKEIINLYNNPNIFSKHIADKYNVDKSVIIRILKTNNVPIKNRSIFVKGKTFEELYGKEKADKIIEKLSKKIKGRKVTWGHKISAGIKNHYKKYPMSIKRKLELSNLHKNLWKNKEYHDRLIAKHREYIKNNPQELERLQSIRPNKEITKIEYKMLEFLRGYFREDEEFYFNKIDLTGKTFYRPDFQFIKQKIIIEVDGYYKHFTKEGKQKDKIREYYLKKVGWKIYRFKFLEIERDYLFDKTKEKVLNLIKNG
jgi:very-short-patch-repair endonuclease